jgi:hypothetical protein
LSSRTACGLVKIIIDTPKGSRNKFKYDAEAKCFRLSRILPAGAQGRGYKPIARLGPDQAEAVLAAAEQRYLRQKTS